jgi:hypothetical protein
MPHRAGHSSARRYAPSPSEQKARTGSPNQMQRDRNRPSPQIPQPQRPEPIDLPRYGRSPTDPGGNNSIQYNIDFTDPNKLVEAGNNSFNAIAGVPGIKFQNTNSPFSFSAGKGFDQNPDFLRLGYGTQVGGGIGNLNAEYDVLNNQGGIGFSTPIGDYTAIDSGTFLPGTLSVNSGYEPENGFRAPTVNYNRSFRPEGVMGDLISNINGGASIGLGANQSPSFNANMRVNPVGGILSMLGYDESKRGFDIPFDVGMNYNLGDNSPRFNIGLGF